MTIVIDASAMVAALIDTGPPGRWAEERLTADHLVAPHLLLVETANVLRRCAASGEISPDVATLAHADLQDVRLDLHGYEPFADRIWELRRNLNAYDAWYVAIAEALDVPLATLDHRLIDAPGPRCRFVTAP
ncbi:MAG: type II toxin-antitoxin system VapC family toxin [Acidimicrobiia bacterium]|nr:type II toxin-antitoxin system VapC family toxin [Acidimicrobiia bacterium]